jgi:eukaryotic-like serine/threonine-protein kinase
VAFESHWYAEEEAPYSYAQGVGIGVAIADLTLSATLGSLGLVASATVLGAGSMELTATLGSLIASSVLTIGVMVQKAVYDIVNAQLQPIIEYSSSDSVPYGYVISWDPPQGTEVLPFSNVTITVSTGPPTSTPAESAIPNVIGLTTWDAATAIFDAGFSVDQYTWEVNDATAGTVLAQDPVSGTLALPGTIIVLTVSAGPTVTTPDVPVPND